MAVVLFHLPGMIAGLSEPLNRHVEGLLASAANKENLIVSLPAPSRAEIIAVARVSPGLPLQSFVLPPRRSGAASISKEGSGVHLLGNPTMFSSRDPR